MRGLSQAPSWPPFSIRHGSEAGCSAPVACTPRATPPRRSGRSGRTSPAGYAALHRPAPTLVPTSRHSEPIGNRFASTRRSVTAGLRMVLGSTKGPSRFVHGEGHAGPGRSLLPVSGRLPPSGGEDHRCVALRSGPQGSCSGDARRRERQPAHRSKVTYEDVIGRDGLGSHHSQCPSEATPPTLSVSTPSFLRAPPDYRLGEADLTCSFQNVGRQIATAALKLSPQELDSLIELRALLTAGKGELRPAVVLLTPQGA